MKRIEDLVDDYTQQCTNLSTGEVYKAPCEIFELLPGTVYIEVIGTDFNNTLQLEENPNTSVYYLGKLSNCKDCIHEHHQPLEKLFDIDIVLEHLVSSLLHYNWDFSQHSNPELLLIVKFH